MVLLGGGVGAGCAVSSGGLGVEDVVDGGDVAVVGGGAGNSSGEVGSASGCGGVILGIGLPRNWRVVLKGVKSRSMDRRGWGGWTGIYFL